MCCVMNAPYYYFYFFRRSIAPQTPSTTKLVNDNPAGSGTGVALLITLTFLSNSSPLEYT